MATFVKIDEKSALFIALVVGLGVAVVVAPDMVAGTVSGVADFLDSLANSL